jgi:hypothetical protein
LVLLKQKVQDKYRYVDSRRQTVLHHCQEGYEREQWTFNRELLNEKPCGSAAAAAASK